MVLNDVDASLAKSIIHHIDLANKKFAVFCKLRKSRLAVWTLVDCFDMNGLKE